MNEWVKDIALTITIVFVVLCMLFIVWANTVGLPHG